MFNRKTKYNSTKTIVDGITFDSKLEARFYSYFISKGIEILELQPKFTLQEKFKFGSESIRAIEYYADFKILYNGICVYVDSKGMEEPVFKLKMKIWKKVYGSNTELVIAKSISDLELKLAHYS